MILAGAGTDRPVRGRRGPSPGLLILAVLVVAVAALWWGMRHRDSAPDYTLGGPLLATPPDSIAGLILTKEGAQYRLLRDRGGQWALSGAASDFLDPGGMRTLLWDLNAAEGGPLLPGTESEDRRYEFNGPQALRLTVLDWSGGRRTLALGTVNPVTGHFYASGMGRSKCFPVTAQVRERVAGLPASVQLQTILPPVDFGRLTTVELWRYDRKHLLARRDGRWWLLPDGQEPPFGNSVIRRYRQYYSDRTREDAAGLWLQASEEEVSLLVYQVSEVLVRQLVPAADADLLRHQWGLTRPWRRIILAGSGINPAPGDESPDRLEVVFGEPLTDDRLPAQRRGTVLLADGKAAGSLDKPLVELVNTGAMTRSPIEALEFTAWRDGEVVLAGRREPGPLIRDGRTNWITTVPDSAVSGWRAERLQYLVGEFLIELNRIPIVAVLPPQSDPAFLDAEDRARLVLTYPEGNGPAREEFFLGRLLPDRLPSGLVAETAAFADEDGVVALWRPAGGQLLLVRSQVVVTLRNFAQIFGRENN